MGKQKITTGLGGLDSVINYLLLGDNVVLQVSNIEEYIRFAKPFVEENLKRGHRIVYLRFADHRPILTENQGVVIYNVNPDDGFEAFTIQVHNIIEREGREVFYVFDCLSDLLKFWATDLMIGNFFRVTCPYLFELDTVAYFAIYRSSNSFQTVAAIRETTQVLLDVYNISGNNYIHPLKVWNRYSPTIFLPHVFEENQFLPIVNSGEVANISRDIPENNFANPKRNLDFWDRMFLDASDLHERFLEGELSSLKEKKLVENLSKTILTRQPRLLKLVTENFSLGDLLQIKSRLIGSGYIGGKALGMLLARNILMQDDSTDWSEFLEHQDSFYVGSDVFYSYLVQNNLWKLWMQQKRSGRHHSLTQELFSKLLIGKFSEDIKQQFYRMLEYFGQSPIVVRSSSLLEDGFGNAFAGKYESVFCINQGTLEERYSQFEEAVRKVFASVMSEDAVSYRLKRGLAQQDEQMALLVQRVSGTHRQQNFLPDLAGVGYSYNTYVWEKGMDPQAGMLRIVLGLGTRAVNRVEGDYARMVALDKPLLKPYCSLGDFKPFSQQKIDVLNVQNRCEESISLQTLVKQKTGLNLKLIADRDYEAEQRRADLGLERQEVWVITFDKLLAATTFTKVMQKMLKSLEKIYKYPVDIEFTVNLKEESLFQVNLLQCRPLEVKGLQGKAEIPKDIEEKAMFFRSEGNFMGGNVKELMRRIIYVAPEEYSQLSERNKCEIARVIGKLNKLTNKNQGLNTLLLGPGRWGSSIPSLGVPVSFSEIDNMTVLAELAYISRGYAPEVSFGTHFFQDLVEAEIFYVALFPERKGVMFRTELFDGFVNVLPKLLPERAEFSEVVKVYDFKDNERKGLHLVSDVRKQDVICYLDSQLNNA